MMLVRELFVLMLVVVAGALVLPAVAEAQEAIPKEVTADMALAAPPSDAPQGWAEKLTLGASGSYGHSSNVVGAVDGATVQLGLLVTGAANRIMGQSTWENVLTITETQTRTPQLPKLIKSADELALQSTYLYRLPGLDWFGPFARVGGSTQVFDSYDVHGIDVTVLRSLRDGSLQSEAIPAAERIALAKPFEPLLVKESLGAFANPYSDKRLAVKTKLGLGMQHIVVRDGFALADDKATPELELRQLQTSTQGGSEAEVELGGGWSDNITWGAKASLFYPFYTTVPTALSGFELVSTDLEAKLSVHLAKWVSLDYVLSAKRVPLIVDAWQVQNNVLLTAGFDLI